MYLNELTFITRHNEKSHTLPADTKEHPEWYVVAPVSPILKEQKIGIPLLLLIYNNPTDYLNQGSTVLRTANLYYLQDKRVPSELTAIYTPSPFILQTETVEGGLYQKFRTGVTELVQKAVGSRFLPFEFEYPVIDPLEINAKLSFGGKKAKAAIAGLLNGELQSLRTIDDSLNNFLQRRGQSMGQQESAINNFLQARRDWVSS